MHTETNKGRKKKICLVVSSLGSGGVGRSAAAISIMLESVGYEVFVVTVLDDIDYEFAGTLINLGELKNKDDTFRGRIERLLYLKKIFKKECFDLIIDSRTRPTILKEILISKFLYYNQNVVYIVHSWKLETYFSKSVFWAKFIYNKKASFVCVSKKISEKIQKVYGLKNVDVIYNAIDIDLIERKAKDTIGIQKPFILFYGRLDNSVKNISLLIEAYKLSDLSQQNINLLIIGDGKDEKQLKDEARNSSIIFKSFTSNPYPFVFKALFSCLTSKYEGFPMVVLESMSVSTPIISVAHNGIEGVLMHEFNGLIVENNNPLALSRAMNEFVKNHQLYSQCKENTKNSVLKYDIAEVKHHWKRIIEKNT